MINQIYWGAPQYIWFLPIVVGAMILAIYRLQLKQQAVALLAGRWSNMVIKHNRPNWQKAKALLISCGIFFLWIALLRPQWNKREQIIMEEGRDLLIALDISRSMLAKDCEPNRLQHAKTKIKRLLNLLEFERVGLLLFSGSAFIQCPLTTDYNAFLMYLDHVDVETISSGTTTLGSALKVAIDIYGAVPNKKSKLLVVFTDGEDFSHNLKQYKDEAKKQKLNVFTIGVGTTEGAPIPLYNEKGTQVGHQKDARGNVVISQLNEQTLQSLSHEAGGAYLPVTTNNDDIKKLVRHISRFEKEKIEDKKIARYEDKYHYFLMMSFICFVLEWLL